MAHAQPLSLYRTDESDGITINGIQAKGSGSWYGSGDKLRIRVDNPVLVDQILSCSVADLHTQFEAVDLELSRGRAVSLWWASANSKAPHPRPEYARFRVRYTIDTLEWTRPWSVKDHVRAVNEKIAARLDGVEPERSSGGSFSILGDVVFTAGTLRDEFHHWMARLDSAEEEAIRDLEAARDLQSLVTFYRFPPDIATACEQYLLYFVQFLQDLGIEADAEVRHKATEVLFRVTPVEGSKALQAIRDALDIYLCLPTDPVFFSTAMNVEDIAVRQLEANVAHLQGQLAIAKAVLQAKDATIDLLELTNFRYRQLVGGVAPSSTVQGDPVAKGSDTEPIIRGIVSVKELETPGLVLHVPELLRALKRRFGSVRRDA